MVLIAYAMQGGITYNDLMKMPLSEYYLVRNEVINIQKRQQQEINKAKKG